MKPDLLRPPNDFLRLQLTAAASVSMLILAWLAWDAYTDYRNDQAQLPVITRMEAVGAEVLHLDEVLTMSARMSAATGDLEWEARYLRLEPQLDRSIKEALVLVPAAAHSTAAATIDSANVALVAMERRGFELVREGRRAEAQRLLSSVEYEDLKNVYASGMREFNGHLLNARRGMRDELQADLLRNVVTTIGASLLLMLCTVLVYRATRRWQAAIVESNRQLNGKTAELEQLNDRLDAKVGERTQELSESVRQHRLVAERAEYLAYYDSLTSLPNRALFSKLLSQAIALAHRDGNQMAVMFVDLDRFKNINDTLGHQAGDLLLQEVARRLQRCVREGDSVARFGGDEFVVLLPALAGTAPVEAVARKILEATGESFEALGQEFRVTASVGISTFPKDGDDERSLMKNADIAMYQAKQEGKNNFQFYAARMDTHSIERLAMESRLRRALERKEFQLYYQPKIAARSGKIVGMEALLRWDHPELGLVAPAAFLPIAEETGLIVSIGQWVLRTACRQNVAWQESGMAPMKIAVNLSARQFTDEDLIRGLNAILDETGMDPALLELEITESTLMHNVAKAISTLRAFRDMGIHLAIDDFGTGYSSLSTLSQFPVDTIKIDGSFVRNLADRPQDRSIAEAIIAMGRSLSLTLVAEGVETKAQVDLLEGCDELQGFYFSEALPVDRIRRLLEAQTAFPAAA